VRRSANRPCIRTRATMAILPPQRTSRVPQPRSRYYPHQATTSPVYPKGYLVRIYCPSPLFLKVSMCSSTVHVADTRPHSPPTSPSPIPTSSASPMLSMAKLIMHWHVRIGVFRFPFVHLTHITSRFLIAFRLVPVTL